MAGGERMSMQFINRLAARAGGHHFDFRGPSWFSQSELYRATPARVYTKDHTDSAAEHPRINSRTNTRNTSTVETKSLSPSALPLD